MITGRRVSKSPEISEKADPVLAVLDLITPGTPLREALELIVQGSNGALIVLGSGPLVNEVCNGGFFLENAPFSPARLAELSKMDGAIVLDDDCQQILAANVHLLPDASMPTAETGSRHRTAERVARQVGKPVITVSERRGVATLYVGKQKHELKEPGRLLADVNQSLITLERVRRRLDISVDRLTQLEVSDQMTFRTVVIVLQRAELVLRIGQKISEDAMWLGGEGNLVNHQLLDLTYDVDRLRALVLKDYVKANTEESCRAALFALEAVPEENLTKPERVAAMLGFEHLDTPVKPFGYRLLAQVPRLPESVRETVVLHYSDLQKLLGASVDQLNDIEGIGRTRATDLRRFFERLSERYATGT